MMVNTVAPVWDGNETWLVLGGAGLYGAFPLAYAVIADALSVPLTAMLIGLIFRGVAFEFRFKAVEHHRAFWDKSFIAGSLLATFSQGVAVGAMLDGIPVEGRSFAGSTMDWLAPFPLFCGVGLVVAYALLGCTWLIMKTEHELHRKMSGPGDTAVDCAVVNYWHHQYLDTVHASEHCTSLVHHAKSVLIPAGACTGAAVCMGTAPRNQARGALFAFPADAGPDFPGLLGSGYQYLAEYYSALGIHLGRRVPAAEPGLYAGR